MKRVYLFCVLVVVFIFYGCAIGDIFIDKAEVYNDLVEKMENMAASEGAFYDEYWALTDNAETENFVNSYNNFKEAFLELDTYFTETRFASDQKIFVEEYNNTYKEVVEEYVDYAGEFAVDVDKNEFTFESMDGYFERMNTHTVDFLEVHNGFSSVINDWAEENSNE